ncbi:MFS transporter [Marinomonas sp. THO17]|uniref:MFS transporter n=1 Tax=Marinomonas sp. THO17 TaxID=3149048 RepID=UPI00336BEE51
MARALSDFISAFNTIVLAAFIFLSQKNAYELSIFFATAVIGGSVASLIGERLSKRIPMTFSIIGLNGIRSLLLLGLILTPSHSMIFILPIIGFLGGLSNALFIILFNSRLPYWIRAQKRTKMNAAITACSAIGAILAGMSSGLLVQYLDYKGVLILNASLYCLVAGLFYLVHQLSTQTVFTDPQVQAKKASFSADLAKPTSSKHFMIGILIMVFLISFANAFHQLGFPDLAKLLSPENLSQSLGYLMSAWGIGKFLGAFSLTRTLKIQSNNALLVMFFVCVLVMSNGFILTFQQSTLNWALLCIFIAGMGESGVEVSQISFIQRQVQQRHTLLFSYLSFAKMIAGALGAILAGQCYRFYSFPLVIFILQIWILITLIITVVSLNLLPKQSSFFATKFFPKNLKQKMNITRYYKQ